MTRMRILITGITGFVGSHLAEWALARGAEVVGALRWRSNTEHIEPLRERLTLIQSDLRDLSSTRELVERAAPAYIVHLAAQSFVAASWQTPAETLMTNAISQMNLFEAIRQVGSQARFLVIGSSEEYGLVYPDELPIRETNPLRPLSPYGVSKVTQDLATSNFAKQVAEIEAGIRKPVVEVGDLKPSRDFSDVRDIVRGYWDLLERGAAGEVYNLCSGVDWSIERMLNFLLAESRVPKIEIRQDPSRLRPSDVPVLRGSAEKIEKAVGWRPQIPLERTLTDLLDYWRARTR
jgi:GDP-4-dehydro-6-deoxy-D-mannose reductase